MVGLLLPCDSIYLPVFATASLNRFHSKELGVEIVGETKMKIAIEEDEDPWDEIEDEVTEEVEKEIENNVDENYIK